ncbi:CDP-diacylglycerol diphosphatase [Streptomyces sp. NRRL F-2664]|uniref:CDP-diacylglycerol diphosphatase n=1 Tax=Streptomyces sp. NRRL F-2664 TaxID=1463842 RepID=UPI000A7F95CB|nr:CDP-diacylglycerol diphosphatase [Streptomyces sp. NRRL F-2664]
MKHPGTTNDMPRRHFVALSGALGAGALLTGTAGGAAAAPRPGPAAGDPPCCPCPTDPTPPPPGTGQAPCPPSQLQGLCGSPADTDPLWQDVQYCTQGIVPPSGQRPNCLKTEPNYVVLHGRPESQNNYLLLPSCRITGIECPFLVSPNAANYWHEAWETGRPGGDVPVRYRYTGLGVNSRSARQLNQLHLHMAGIQTSTQLRLQALEASGRVALHPSQWGDTQYQALVTGKLGSGDRTYRVLRLDSLAQNLFELLNVNVVRRFGLDMAGQTLIVVPKVTATGFTGSFYALSSDSSLPSGTNTCDHLLVYT